MKPPLDRWRGESIEGEGLQLTAHCSVVGAHAEEREWMPGVAGEWFPCTWLITWFHIVIKGVAIISIF